jgi:hypothetical protein
MAILKRLGVSMNGLSFLGICILGIIRKSLSSYFSPLT